MKHTIETEAGWRPGWDLAGTVIKQAANGKGPKVGSRVVGMIADSYTRLDAGAWVEQVAVPTNMLAEIPASMTFAQAATLPVVGVAQRLLQRQFTGKAVLYLNR